MIDRRRLMFTAAAGAAMAATGQAIAQTAPAAPTAAANPASQQLHALLQKVVEEMVLKSPETLTSLGFDKGPNAAVKAQLDDRSQAKIDRDKVDFRAAIAAMDGIDRATLNAQDGIYFDTLKFFGDTVMQGYDFPYGGGFFPSPYTVSQLSGAYQGIPDFLDSQHTVETGEDAEAYLSRLSAFGTALDQETVGWRRSSPPGPFRLISSWPAP